MQQKIIEEQIINIEKIRNHYYNKNNGHTYQCYIKSCYPDDLVYIIDEYQRFTLQSHELNGEKLKEILEKEFVSEYTYVRIVYAVISEYLYSKYKNKLCLYLNIINYDNKDYRYYLYFNLSNLECGKIKISEIRDFVENRFYLKQIDSITLDYEKRICFVPKDNNWEQLYTLYQLMNLIK